MRFWLLPAYPCVWLLARLPQGALLGLGRLLTRLFWPLLGRRRHVAERNIALCFPEQDAAAQARLVEASVQEAVIGMLESLRGLFAPAARLDDLYEVQGMEHLHAALARGRGVLLLTAHFTTVELQCALLNHAARREGLQPLAMLVRRLAWAPLEAAVDAGRRRWCGETLEKKDVSGLLRMLKSGRAVFYAADQNFTFQNAFVPFFGVSASTLTAPSRLARRSGSTVLPVWSDRDAEGRYRLRILPPWDRWPSDDPVADTARYMQELEQVVRERPEQYLWVHRRFKTRPEGEPPVY